MGTGCGRPEVAAKRIYNYLQLPSFIAENTLMATIKVIQNGPYLVQGDDVTAVDWNGASYAIAKRPFALCRCGASTTKPFCDGTHSRTGFKAAEAAVPGSQDKPSNER
jgi:3-phenylpropionate/trans-cinnamate dioxygenase ferredoxin subunit